MKFTQSHILSIEGGTIVSRQKSSPPYIAAPVGAREDEKEGLWRSTEARGGHLEVPLKTGHIILLITPLNDLLGVTTIISRVIPRQKQFSPMNLQVGFTCDHLHLSSNYPLNNRQNP